MVFCREAWLRVRAFARLALQEFCIDPWVSSNPASVCLHLVLRGVAPFFWDAGSEGTSCLCSLKTTHNFGPCLTESPFCPGGRRSISCLASNGVAFLWKYSLPSRATQRNLSAEGFPLRFPSVYTPMKQVTQTMRRPRRLLHDQFGHPPVLL